jgi:multidrug efflux pump
LGLLVDDAIIAVEMMVRKLEEGHDKRYAATFAYDVTAMPMLTGTLITAAGFLPIGLAQVGDRGVHLRDLCRHHGRAADLVGGFGVLRALPGAPLLRSTSKVEGQRTSCSTRPSTRRFRRMVNWCVGHRWITIGATIAVFALGVVGMGKVQQQFFPDSSRPEILVDLWLPEGSTLLHSNEVAQALRAPHGARTRRAERQHLGRLRRAAFLLAAGRDLRHHQRQPDHRAAEDAEATARCCANNCPALLAEEFSTCAGRVKLLPNGPPVPYPVQFRVVGTTRPCCASGPTRRWRCCVPTRTCAGVNDNWNEKVKVLRLEVDQDKARALGVTSQAIAQAARTILVGSTIGQYREADRLIDIVLRQPLDERTPSPTCAMPTCPPPAAARCR